MEKETVVCFGTMGIRVWVRGEEISVARGKAYRERGFDREARPEREIERDVHRRELEMIEKKAGIPRRTAGCGAFAFSAGDLRIDAVRQEPSRAFAQ